MQHEHSPDLERPEGYEPQPEIRGPAEPVGFETDPRQTDIDPDSTIPPLVDSPDQSIHRLGDVVNQQEKNPSADGVPPQRPGAQEDTAWSPAQEDLSKRVIDEDPEAEAETDPSKD